MPAAGTAEEDKPMRFQEAARVQTSLLAPVEKRCLLWMAARLPLRVNSDHLTALAGIAMLAAGASYALAPGRPALLVAVVVLLAVNWFGDSLDGTLARVRHHERPRYGFYVDHVLDAVSILFLIAGLVLGGYMTGAIGAGFLIAYYLLTIEIALATHAVGTFRISYWKFGPTELRILLAVGTLQLLRSPLATVAGHQFLLFDIGGAVAIVGLLATFVASAVTNTKALYRAEPLPQLRTPNSELRTPNAETTTQNRTSKLSGSHRAAVTTF
jgi:phosphatidylglycerophosphate synthase